jgi:O-antigen/teichoic acid export membrane protein
MLIARTLRTMPGQVAGPLAQMAAAVAFTHWLSPDELGVYALAWAAQELAYFGVLSWWSAYVQRFAQSHADGAARTRLNAAETAVHLIAAVLQTAIACIAIMVVFDQMPDPAFMAALAAFTVTRNMGMHFGGRARAEGSDLAFSIIQIVGPLGGLTLGILAVATISPTAEMLLLAYSAAQVLSLMLGLPFMRFAPARPRIEPAMLKASWVYGAPLILAGLLEWGASQGVRVIVQLDMGPVEVGLMTTAWWLGLRISAFVSLLVTGATFYAAIARLESQGQKAAQDQLADNGALMLGLLAPATVGATLLAVPFAELLVAEPYQAITASLLPLALLAGSMKAYREHGPEQAFLVFRRTTASIWTALTEMALTVIGCAIGLTFGGLYGAILGCALASTASAAFSYVLAARLVGYFVRLADIASFAFATAAMACVVVALPQPHDVAGLALSVIAGAAAYGVVCLAFWWKRLPALKLQRA